MGVAANKAAGDPDFRCWTRLLPGILSDLNRKFVSGTRYRRNSVDDDNFEDMLADKYGLEDPSLMWNTRTVSAGSIKSEKWKKRLWKFRPGQKVLVKRNALKAEASFQKPSVHGGYDPETYTVFSRSLASTDSDSLVPGKGKGQ